MDDVKYIADKSSEVSEQKESDRQTVIQLFHFCFIRAWEQNAGGTYEPLWWAVQMRRPLTSLCAMSSLHALCSLAGR